MSRFLFIHRTTGRVLAAFCLLLLASAAGCSTAPRPSDFVELGTRLIASGAREDLQRTNSAAANLGPYTVPANRVLVVTSVKIIPDNPGPGTLKIDLLQKNATVDAIRKFWVLPANGPTQYDIPDSGIVVGPGYILSLRDSGGSAASFRGNLYGYEARLN